MTMNRVAVLLAEDGLTKRTYPVPRAFVPRQEGYKFDNRLWKVVAIISPDTTQDD